jgi:hypothetical protein
VAVVGELADELLNWDSRFWRTLLPLLLRPGFLTAEFIAGRRARYVPPFRLYLLISFVLFLFVSLTATPGDAVKLTTDAPLTPGADGSALPEQRELSDDDFQIDLAGEDSPRWLRDLDARLEQNAAKLAHDPGAFSERLFEYLPQTMFILLPVFALLLRCCYLFSPFHYLQHLVFSLHYQSFVYLLYLLVFGVGSWLYKGSMAFPLILACYIYLLLALRRSYGSSFAGAASKAIVILAIDAVAMALALALASVLVVALL